MANDWQVHGHWVAAALNAAMANISFMFSSSSSAEDADIDFENDITGEVTGTNVPSGGIAATGGDAFGRWRAGRSVVVR